MSSSRSTIVTTCVDRNDAFADDVHSSNGISDSTSLPSGVKGFERALTDVKKPEEGGGSSSSAVTSVARTCALQDSTTTTAASFSKFVSFECIALSSS
jgi:hypothetical protein